VSFPVVGIGASAGGLEAFSELLTNLPANMELERLDSRRNPTSFLGGLVFLSCQCSHVLKISNWNRSTPVRSVKVVKRFDGK
jgi:hypothetical protein